MMVAMVAEAALCLPKLKRRHGEPLHECLAVAHISGNTVVDRCCRSWPCLPRRVFCYIAWRRSGYRPSMGLLELLRLALVGLVAILLNQPEWIEEFRPEEKPAIAVLWDASASMDTRDVVPADQPAAAAAHHAARGDRPAGRTSTWNKLRERMNVVIQPFAEPRPGHGTDLNDPLAARRRRSRTCAGSCWPPTATGTRDSRRSRRRPGLRMRGVPIFAVPVGSRTRLPDVELLSLDLPTFGIAGKSVRVPFTIDSSLPREFVDDCHAAGFRRRRGDEGSARSPR